MKLSSPPVHHNTDRARRLWHLVPLCLALLQPTSMLAEAADNTASKKQVGGAKPARLAKSIPAHVAGATAKPPKHRVVLTGSRIPMEVSRSGFATDGPYALYVIGSKQMARTGASTLAGVLRRTGLAR